MDGDSAFEQSHDRIVRTGRAIENIPLPGVQPTGSSSHERAECLAASLEYELGRHGVVYGVIALAVEPEIVHAYAYTLRCPVGP